MLKVYTGFNMAHVADEIMNTFYDYIHSGDHYTDHSLVNSEIKIFESKNVLFEYPECYVHPIHFKNLTLIAKLIYFKLHLIYLMLKLYKETF